MHNYNLADFFYPGLKAYMHFSISLSSTENEREFTLLLIEIYRRDSKIMKQLNKLGALHIRLTSAFILQVRIDDH